MRHERYVMRQDTFVVQHIVGLPGILTCGATSFVACDKVQFIGV